MGRKSKVPESPHKQRLTLAELADHDDVCSDVMVDNAYFKSRIRKYRPKHIPVRGVKEDDVPQIMLHKVIVGKDVVAAEKELLKLQGLVRYRKSLKSKAKDEHFLDHLRKYIYMYQTDCPWEVSTTNRYTITNYEAAVTARRRMKQGETIKYLTGTLVPLSTAESMDLDMTNRNFSIVVNARKKSDQMFLGPARFANHDCSPNGRLIMKGVDSMEVKADKNINIGDEITVSYGDNYFGPDNVECLCHTCEVFERNGWTSKAAFAAIQSGSSTPVPDVRPSSHLMGKKRKGEPASPLSQPGRALKRLKPLASPSKLQYSWTPPSTSESEAAHEDTITPMAVGHQQVTPPSRSKARSDKSETPKRDDRGRFIASASKASTEPKKDKLSEKAIGKRRKSFPPSPSTTSPSSQDSENDPPFEMRELNDKAQGQVTIKVEAVEKTTLEVDPASSDVQDGEDTIMVDGLDRSSPTAADVPDIDEMAINGATETELETPFAIDEPYVNIDTTAPQAFTTLTMTKVSTIASIEPEPDKSIPTPAEVVPSIEPLTTTTTIKTVTKAKITVTPLSDSIRVPGDYILTRKLLAQPHDRWVRCHNDFCHTFFLQPNGYQTRRECPRCERHSMLYGFPWPKTDPDARKLLSRQGEAKSGRGRPPKTPFQPATTTIVIEDDAGQPQPRRLKSEVNPRSKYSAYRRQGKCGKGTWVEGGGDDEERVMDHRTIHRFVLPDEERELTRKGLLVEAEQARSMGEAELEVLASLDGRRARFKAESGDRGSASARESTGLYGSGGGNGLGAGMGGGSGNGNRTGSATDGERGESASASGWDDMDAEGRRRSNRIVESRVYVSVNMRR